MQLSIVIPLFNEQDSLTELTESIQSIVLNQGLDYEIILIDDGSTDKSWSIIRNICSKDSNIKGIRFRRNFGKSQALAAGFKLCKGEVVITMDADLQDDPNEIPDLYKKIALSNFDLVSGWKKKRYDSFILGSF